MRAKATKIKSYGASRMPAGTCSALKEADFSHTTGKRRREYIEISFKDGNSDIIRFGRCHQNDPARVLVQTQDPDRIQEFKLLGLAKGSTPSGQAIAMIGAYKRSLLKETKHGFIAKGWQDKWDIADQVQKELLKVEAAERALVPGDFKGQEAIREQIIQIIDRGIMKNEKLSAGLVSTPGRLFHALRSARIFIQDEYQYPYTAFSKADQLYFERPEGDRTPFVYDSAMHLQDGEDALNSIHAFYRRFKPEKIVETRNPLKRAGFFKDKKPASNLDFMNDEKRGILRRFTHNGQTLVQDVWRTCKTGLRQTKGFAQKEWQDFSYIEGQQPSKVAASAPVTVEEEAAAKKELDELIEEAHKYESSRIMIQPEHSYFCSLMHDNLIRKLMGGVQHTLHGIEHHGISNPVSMMAITALSALTFGALATPHLLSVLLKGIGVQNPDVVIHTIQGLLDSHDYSTAVNFLQVMQLASLEKRMAFFLSEHANQLVMETATKGMENPIDLSIFLVEALSFSIQISHMSAGGLSEEAGKNAMMNLNAFASVPFNLDRLRLLNGVPMNELNTIASILTFPLQLTAAPLRLLLSPFVALPACFREGSLRPLGVKLKQELNHFRSQVGKALLASIDLTATLLETVYGAVTFYPNVLFKFACVCVSAPLASIGAALKQIGLTKTGNGFKKASDFIIEGKYFIERNLGQLNRTIVRYAIKWPNQKIHALFQPSHMFNRIKRLKSHFSDLKQVYARTNGPATSESTLMLHLLSAIETALDAFIKSKEPNEQKYKTLKDTLNTTLKETAHLLQKQGGGIDLSSQLQRHLNDLIRTIQFVQPPSSTPALITTPPLSKDFIRTRIDKYSKPAPAVNRDSEA